MGLYARYRAPPLINLACGEAPIRKQRRKIVPRAEGVALELGFGAGGGGEQDDDQGRDRWSHRQRG